MSGSRILPNVCHCYPLPSLGFLPLAPPDDSFKTKWSWNPVNSVQGGQAWGSRWFFCLSVFCFFISARITPRSVCVGYGQHGSLAHAHVLGLLQKGIVAGRGAKKQAGEGRGSS